MPKTLVFRAVLCDAELSQGFDTVHQSNSLLTAIVARAVWAAGTVLWLLLGERFRQRRPGEQTAIQVEPFERCWHAWDWLANQKLTCTNHGARSTKRTGLCCWMILVHGGSKTDTRESTLSVGWCLCLALYCRGLAPMPLLLLGQRQVHQQGLRSSQPLPLVLLILGPVLILVLRKNSPSPTFGQFRLRLLPKPWMELCSNWSCARES